jgi:hypothetical protein
MRAALLRGARGADLRMAPADQPYSLAVTGSGLGRWSVTGGGNRLTLNGRRLSGSGRSPSARITSPGANPLPPVPLR